MKKDENFNRKLQELLQKSDVKDMLNRMREMGITDEQVLHFTIGYALCLLDQQKETEEKKQELRDNEAEIQEKMKKKTGNDSPFLGSREYPEKLTDREETDNFVQLIREKILLGHYDPRNMGQKGAKYAKKAGIWLGKKGAKKVASQHIVPMVVAPIFPPILLPWMVGSLVHKFTGADHEKLYLVVVQLLLQRLLLAAHGISINSYY